MPDWHCRDSRRGDSYGFYHCRVNAAFEVCGVFPLLPYRGGCCRHSNKVFYSEHCAFHLSNLILFEECPLKNLSLQLSKSIGIYVNVTCFHFDFSCYQNVFMSASSYGGVPAFKNLRHMVFVIFKHCRYNIFGHLFLVSMQVTKSVDHDSSLSIS